MSAQKFGKFVNDNIVLLVSVPFLIALHWGWWKIQQNPALVDPKDRKELPVFKAYRTMKEQFLQSGVSAPVGGEPETRP